jgi:RNA polymerase-binding transcription factor DksA
MAKKAASKKNPANRLNKSKAANTAKKAQSNEKIVHKKSLPKKTAKAASKKMPEKKRGKAIAMKRVKEAPKAAAKKVTKKAVAAKKPGAVKKTVTVTKQTTTKKTSSRKESGKIKAVKSPKESVRSKAPAVVEKTLDKKGNKLATKKIAAQNPLPIESKKPSTALKKSIVVSKIGDKKPAPVTFSLEDVEELLKNRKEKSELIIETDKTAASSTQTALKSDKKPAIEKLPIEKRKHSAASLMDILGFNPNQKKSAIDLDPKEVPAKWKKYYNLLIELRNHLKDELELHTSETLKHSTREDSGDLSGYGQHQADAATDSFDRDFALSLLSAEQDALYEIEEAIKRINNGTYGRCEVSGEGIPKERLLAVPFTRFSIEGQREFEKNKRRKVDRGTAFADSSDGVSLAGDDDDE